MQTLLLTQKTPLHLLYPILNIRYVRFFVLFYHFDGEEKKIETHREKKYEWQGNVM
jgi:hypothetical protein